MHGVHGGAAAEAGQVVSSIVVGVGWLMRLLHKRAAVESCVVPVGSRLDLIALSFYGVQCNGLHGAALSAAIVRLAKALDTLDARELSSLRCRAPPPPVLSFFRPCLTPQQSQTLHTCCSIHHTRCSNPPCPKHHLVAAQRASAAAHASAPLATQARGRSTDYGSIVILRFIIELRSERPG